MEERFYRQPAEAVRTWEEAFADLEDNEQRQVVATAAQSGLL
jgi:hypothetical protein